MDKRIEVLRDWKRSETRFYGGGDPIDDTIAWTERRALDGREVMRVGLRYLTIPDWAFAQMAEAAGYVKRE